MTLCGCAPSPSFLSALPSAALPAGRVSWSCKDASRQVVYSLQDTLVLGDLLSAGRLPADSSKGQNYADWPDAYAWIAKTTEARTKVPTPAGVWWAWAGVERQWLIDMVVSEYSQAAPASFPALLELHVPASLLLLSDFNEWHSPLNGAPAYTPEEEELLMAAWEAGQDWEHPLERLPSSHPDLQATWDLVLRSSVSRPVSRYATQATFSLLRADDLVCATVIC